jgi:hypothetical protein
MIIDIAVVNYRQVIRFLILNIQNIEYLASTDYDFKKAMEKYTDWF